MTNRATTVQEYLAALPPDRREAIEAVRRVILENLPEGFEEGMDFGMIGYHVPLSRYPDTHNGRPLGIAALASQKGYMALYLMSVYGDPALARSADRSANHTSSSQRSTKVTRTSPRIADTSTAVWSFTCS